MFVIVRKKMEKIRQHETIEKNLECYEKKSRAINSSQSITTGVSQKLFNHNHEVQTKQKIIHEKY